jgi:hypothetical protein
MWGCTLFRGFSIPCIAEFRHLYETGLPRCIPALHISGILYEALQKAFRGYFQMYSAGILGLRQEMRIKKRGSGGLEPRKEGGVRCASDPVE